jgi:quinol-cytochrome oxidoreductase complex cytochrome b subunit
MVDIIILSYVGAHEPSGDFMLWTGRIATFVYFALFLILPFTSKWEDKLMEAKGLPKALIALEKAEQKALRKAQ